MHQSQEGEGERRYLSRLVATASEMILHLPSNRKMPYLNIQITRGATRSHKAEL